eukprot:gene10005-11028_t
MSTLQCTHIPRIITCLILILVSSELGTWTLGSSLEHGRHGSSSKPFFKRYEKDLLNELLTNYSVYFRPTTSNHAPVIVHFDFKLVQIVNVDIKYQVFIVNSIITMRWNDPQLTWNETQWNGTKYIIVPPYLIWTPDIALYNNADGQSKSMGDILKVNILIASTGVVIWKSEAKFKSSCAVDTKWFPFDRQVCILSFGSQSYSKTRLEIRFTRKPKKAKEIESHMHFSSGEWNIKNISSKLRDKKMGCCHDSYSLIEYTFTLDRMCLYYMLYLVLPCVCLILMGPCMFFIPPDSGERSGFGVTIVLALSVYLLVISEKLPEKSDKTPILGILYTLMFLLLALALICGILVTYLVSKTTKPSPWLHRLVFKQKHINNNKVISNEMQVTDVDNNETTEETTVRQNVKGASTPAAIEEDHINRQKWKAIGAKLDTLFIILYFALSIFAPCTVVIAFYATH